MAQRNSPLRLRFAEGELTVSAQTQDVGEARESLPVSFDGEALEIGFNAEFLREGSSRSTRRRAPAEAISPLRPAVLQGEPTDFTYLIMPIRLGRLIVTRGLAHATSARTLRLDLELQPGLVLVVGPNGAGKTNLLESLHVGTQGFSPRTRPTPS